MPDSATNAVLYSLNALTGIELEKQLILTQRPLVGGTPVLLSGEGSGGPAPALENVVYQTGDQNISGEKVFLDALLIKSPSGKLFYIAIDESGALLTIQKY
jgi:hypothetical protein